MNAYVRLQEGQKMSPDHPIQIAADYVTAAASTAVIAASWANLLDGVEKLVAGALVIVLLGLRIRSHLRRDRAEKLGRE